MKLPGREGLTAVVAGTITDDVRIQEIPKLKVWRWCGTGNRKGLCSCLGASVTDWIAEESVLCFNWSQGWIGFKLFKINSFL